jgi:hypothetical protein
MPTRDSKWQPRPEGLDPETTQWACLSDRDGLIWTVEMVIDPTLPEDLRSDVDTVEHVLQALFIDYEASCFDMVIGGRYSIAAYDSLTPGADGYLCWTDRFAYVGADPARIGTQAMIPIR